LLLLEEYETEYRYNHEPAPTPPIDHIFSTHEYSQRLYIRLNGATVCCWFDHADQIELDVHPAEVRDEAQRHSVLDFVRRVAMSVGLPARISPEGQPDSPFFVFNPDGSISNGGG